MIQLLLADHDGPVDRRDWLGMAAGLAALLCSGVAITMTLVVGIATLLRRGWRVAMLHTVPLGVVYLTWSLVTPKGQGAGHLGGQSPVQVLRFVGIGVQAAFGGLGGVTGLGAVLALALLVGCGIVIHQRAWRTLRGRAAVPVSMLAGALVFLVVTGVFRAGASGLAALFANTGPERARQSRYVYVVAALLLPALALAAEVTLRHWHRLAAVVAAVLAIATVGNAVDLANQQRFRRVSATENFVLTAPRLPIAVRLPRSLKIATDLPIGWLITAARAGKLPAPPTSSAAQTATYTLHLALQPSTIPPTAHCQAFARSELRTMQRDTELTVTEGSASITYAPLGGAFSHAELLTRGAFFPPVTRVAVVGPLRLRITPAANSRVSLCAQS